jgi:hypothetical protein
MSRSRSNPYVRANPDLVAARHAWREAAAMVNSGQQLGPSDTGRLIEQAEALLVAAQALRAIELKLREVAS